MPLREDEASVASPLSRRLLRAGLAHRRTREDPAAVTIVGESLRGLHLFLASHNCSPGRLIGDIRDGWASIQAGAKRCSSVHLGSLARGDPAKRGPHPDSSCTARAREPTSSSLCTPLLLGFSRKTCNDGDEIPFSLTKEKQWRPYMRKILRLASIVLCAALSLYLAALSLPWMPLADHHSVIPALAAARLEALPAPSPAVSPPLPRPRIPAGSRSPSPLSAHPQALTCPPRLRTVPGSAGADRRRPQV